MGGVGIIGAVLSLMALGQPGATTQASSEADRIVALVSSSAGAGERMIRALRSDAIRYNCVNAMDRLESMGPEVVPLLEKALQSDDRQQRYAACVILSVREDYSPSPLMLHVCVQGLRDDDCPFDGESYTYIFNAARSVRYLVHHAAAAEKDLTEAMESTDLQQRFLAAVVLGWSGRDSAAKRVTEILIPHLRDNVLSNDAILAGGALYRMGEAALPFVQEAAKAPVDIQQKEWLGLIATDIQDPPLTGQKQWERRKLHAVDRMWDPAVGYSLGGIGLCWGHMSVEQRDTPSNPEELARFRARIIEARDRS